MNLPDRFRALAIRLLTSLAGQPVASPSFMRKPTGDGSIDDGVLYDLPSVITRNVGRLAAVPPDKQIDWLLQEASDTATYGFQFDTPYRGANDLPFVFTEDALREDPWAVRRAKLIQCHTAYHLNPIAKRAVNYMADFVVGEGFSLTCKNKDVEKLLNDFIEHPDNGIRERENQVVKDLIVDGELFWRWYDGAGDTAGQTTFIPMRPWECQWVNAEPAFYRRPIDYRFVWRVTQGDAPFGQQTATEDIPAAEILHVAIGNHTYEIRGRSELYNVLAWLRTYKEWLENRARQNHWRGALLWWVKLLKARPETVAQKAAQYQKPPTPGSIVVTTENEEWSPLTNSIGSSDAGEDGRQIKLMTAVGFGIPEYFLADGTNANRATSEAQQLPALMTFGEFQRVMTTQVWKPVFRRVIQNAVDAGKLPAQVVEQDAEGDDLTDDVKDKNGVVVSSEKRMIDAIRAFDVRYEPLSSERDAFTLAQALQIAAANGWVSGESSSRELGFDWDGERKRIRREAEAEANDVTAGRKPPPVGMRPQAMNGEPPLDANGQPMTPEMIAQQDQLKQQTPKNGAGA